MARIRLNKGGLYPTGESKRAGFKDQYFEHICETCKKKIFKNQSCSVVCKKEADGTFTPHRYHGDGGCMPLPKAKDFK